MERDTRRSRDTAMKVALAVGTVERLAAEKQQNAAWGQFSVKLFWEDGYLKIVEINDTTTIKDLPRHDLDDAGEVLHANEALATFRRGPQRRTMG